MVIDLHTHTSFGSRCSYMEPQGLVRKAKQIGLDAVCITEHDVSWAAADLESLSREHGVPVFGGVEVTTEQGEFLVFGVCQPMWAISSAEELRELVDGAGGVMIAAHPFRANKSPNNQAQMDEICSRPIFKLVDAVEVFDGRSPRRESDFGCEALRRLNLKGTAGSDAHAVHALGECVTVFERPIADESELVSELKAGRFKAVHRMINRTI